MNRLNRFTATLVIVCMVTAPLAGAVDAPAAPPSNQKFARFCGELAKGFEAQGKDLKTKLPAAQVDDAIAKAIRDCPIDMAEVEAQVALPVGLSVVDIKHKTDELTQKLVNLSKDLASEIREKQALDLKPIEPEARPSGYRLNARSEQLGTKITEDLIQAKKIALGIGLLNERAGDGKTLDIDGLDRTHHIILGILAGSITVFAASAYGLFLNLFASRPGYSITTSILLLPAIFFNVRLTYLQWKTALSVPPVVLKHLAARKENSTDTADAQADVASVLSVIALAHGCRPREVKKLRVDPSITADPMVRTRVQTQVEVPEPVREEFENADPIEAGAAAKAKTLPLPQR